MTAPPGGVLALPIAPHPGPVEDDLDPASQAARGLRLLGPDRPQGANHEVGIDVGHRLRTEHRAAVGRERIGPLVDVLGVAPAGAVGGDVLVCGLLEGDRPGRGERFLGALGVADLDRVALVLEEFTGLSGALARIGEADRLEGPEPHLARAAVEGEAEHP